MKLTKQERIGLIHQHRIIQRLYPDEVTDNEKAIEILINGYEYLYDELYGCVYDGEDTMSEEECKEVWDTLSMFESIDRTIKDMGAKHYDGMGTKFFGYDGNNEGKFLGFAEFTVMKLRRFSHLPLEKDNYFNSHTPARNTYGNMLSVWKKIDVAERYPMSQENLDKVLDASGHPKQIGQ